MLLEKGASKDCHDDFGITPLFVAAQYGQLESLRLLLSHGNHNPSFPLLQFHQLPLNALLALLLHVIISNILFPYCCGNLLSLKPPLKNDD